MYRIQKAQHIGRNHVLDGSNCQDALVVGEKDGAVYGVICDGASLISPDWPTKPHSEVGATLGAAFLAERLRNDDPDMDRESLALNLESSLDWWFEKQLDVMYFVDETLMTRYLLEHFLFTVVGFRLVGATAVVFWQGDGTIVVNDEIIHLNVGSQPDYPAYWHMPGALPNGYVPQNFEYRIFQGVTRLMIGSDSWKNEPELLNEIWTCDLPLQRQINVWNEMDHHFSDDVSVITVEVTQ